jgi:hypothetical protein
MNLLDWRTGTAATKAIGRLGGIITRGFTIGYWLTYATVRLLSLKSGCCETNALGQ